MKDQDYTFTLTFDGGWFDKISEDPLFGEATVSLIGGVTRATFTETSYSFDRVVRGIVEVIQDRYHIIDVLNEDGTPNLEQKCHLAAHRLVKKLNYPGWLSLIGVGSSYGFPCIMINTRVEPHKRPEFCEESWEQFEVVWRHFGEHARMGDV